VSEWVPTRYSADLMAETREKMHKTLATLQELAEADARGDRATVLDICERILLECIARERAKLSGPKP
jgi:hypothetical protein